MSFPAIIVLQSCQ